MLGCAYCEIKFNWVLGGAYSCESYSNLVHASAYSEIKLVEPCHLYLLLRRSQLVNMFEP